MPLPYEVEADLSESLETCEPLFGVVKARESKDKRDAFCFDENLRIAALTQAEADMQCVMT